MIGRLLCWIGRHEWRGIDMTRPHELPANGEIVYIVWAPVTCVCGRCYASK